MPIKAPSPVIPLPDPPAVTLIFDVTVAPYTMDRQLVIPTGVLGGHIESGAIESDVTVGVNTPAAAGHPVTRFVTFTEPRPVARSYPEVALKPRVPVGFPLLSTVSKTPRTLEFWFVLLQLKVPPAHG